TVTGGAVVPLAGCGDDETVIVTVTVRASTLTGPGTTAPPVTVTTPTTTQSTEAALELRLPAPGSIPNVRPGSVRPLATPQDLVSALYSPGDPTAANAVQRLTAAGYEQGVIRDQPAQGEEGPRLVRTYIFRLRDNASARAEVQASADEIRSTTTAPIRDVDLGEAAGQGLRIDAGNQDILFVTFAAGRDVYGIQSFAPSGRSVQQAEIVELSGNLYRAWNTP
ncbi:MAG TPA: hypothetical protein VNT51_07135, partial [Miltoncostaeaceae bacterium]|nr:hypothetical protein [Miltoncostaeaceae bacterium]